MCWDGDLTLFHGYRHRAVARVCLSNPVIGAQSLVREGPVTEVLRRLSLMCSIIPHVAKGKGRGFRG